MRLIKIGKTLILIGFAMFVIQNMIFGWNAVPMSEAEETTDIINKVFLYGGLWLYILPIWDLYENAIKKLYDSKKQL